MIKTLSIACGSDDGVNFTNEHFGSAKFYLLYSLNLNTGSIKYTKKLANTSVSETFHGDPAKASSVSELLDGVQVIVGLAMGSNVVRMRKRFVPVISREKNIKLALEKLKGKLDSIRENLDIPTGKDKSLIFIG